MTLSQLQDRAYASERLLWDFRQAVDHYSRHREKSDEIAARNRLHVARESLLEFCRDSALLLSQAVD